MDLWPTKPSCSKEDSLCSRTRCAEAARRPRRSNGARQGSWPIFQSENWIVSRIRAGAYGPVHRKGLYNVGDNKIVESTPSSGSNCRRCQSGFRVNTFDGINVVQLLLP